MERDVVAAAAKLISSKTAYSIRCVPCRIFFALFFVQFLRRDDSFFDGDAAAVVEVVSPLLNLEIFCRFYSMNSTNNMRGQKTWTRQFCQWAQQFKALHRFVFYQFLTPQCSPNRTFAGSEERQFAVD